MGAQNAPWWAASVPCCEGRKGDNAESGVRKKEKGVEGEKRVEEETKARRPEISQERPRRADARIRDAAIAPKSPRRKK